MYVLIADLETCVQYQLDNFFTQKLINWIKYHYENFDILIIALSERKHIQISCVL